MSTKDNKTLRSRKRRHSQTSGSSADVQESTERVPDEGSEDDSNLIIEGQNKPMNKESLEAFTETCHYLLYTSMDRMKTYCANDLDIIRTLFNEFSVEGALQIILHLKAYLAEQDDEYLYENAGRLLIGVSMFNRRAYEFPEPHKPPTATLSQTYDKVRFDLEIENCETDTGPLMELVESGEKWKDLLTPIINIYSQRYDGDPRKNKTVASINMKRVLYRLIDFLNILRSAEYYFHQRRNLRLGTVESIPGNPDGFLYINDQVQMIIEFKPFSILPKQRFSEVNEINVEVSDLEEPFKQSFCYMLDTGCPRVLLSDGQTSLFLVFDYENAYSKKKLWETQGKAPAPLRVYSSNIKSMLPSFAESHLSWLLSSEKAIKEFKMKEMMWFYTAMRKKLGPGKSNSSTKSPTSALPLNLTSKKHTWGIPSIYINSGQSISIESGSAFQIFKVDADTVSASGHNLNPKEQVVVKIFGDQDSSNYLSSAVSNMPLSIGMEACYQKERKCINRLLEDPDFNNCYFKHDEVKVTVNVGHWGKCVLRRFIDTMKLPKNKKTYNKVKQQLDIIHKHGILHNDIDRESILYSKEGTVYIIDFGNCTIIDKEDETYYSEDNECLRKMFHRKRSRNL